MKKKPIRHSAIYTSPSSGCLRIMRADAIIYVTPENARQFLDNLDNGEPFELSDGTPTTVVDVPCLVSIELTAEEVQLLKADIEYEFVPRRNAYCFTRYGSRCNGGKARNARLVAARDEYIRSHGLTLAELSEVGVSAFKQQPVLPFAALKRMILAGQVPTGSVLIIDSLRTLRLDSTNGLFETCRAIQEILGNGVGVVLLDPLYELKPTDDFLVSAFRTALYAACFEMAKRRDRARGERCASAEQCLKVAILP